MEVEQVCQTRSEALCIVEGWYVEALIDEKIQPVLSVSKEVVLTAITLALARPISLRPTPPPPFSRDVFQVLEHHDAVDNVCASRLQNYVRVCQKGRAPNRGK